MHCLVYLRKSDHEIVTIPVAYDENTGLKTIFAWARTFEPNGDAFGIKMISGVMNYEINRVYPGMLE